MKSEPINNICTITTITKYSRGNKLSRLNDEWRGMPVTGVYLVHEEHDAIV